MTTVLKAEELRQLFFWGEGRGGFTQIDQGKKRFKGKTRRLLPYLLLQLSSDLIYYKEIPRDLVPVLGPLDFFKFVNNQGRTTVNGIYKTIKLYDQDILALIELFKSGNHLVIKFCEYLFSNLTTLHNCIFFLCYISHSTAKCCCRRSQGKFH